MAIADDEMVLFDVETTGLGRDDHIVQLAWLITNRAGHIRKQGNYIVRPDNFVIPGRAAQIHGITTELAQHRGIAIREILLRFVADAAATRIMVAHNIAFDVKMLDAELKRAKIPFDLVGRLHICTMRASTQWCRLPKLNGKTGFKFPRLEELHWRLFGEGFEGAHDALVDITATLRCFQELCRLKVLHLPPAASLAPAPKTPPASGQYGANTQGETTAVAAKAPPAREQFNDTNGPLTGALRTGSPQAHLPIFPLVRPTPALPREFHPIPSGAAAKAEGTAATILSTNPNNCHYHVKDIARGVMVSFNGKIIRDVLAYGPNWVQVTDDGSASGAAQILQGRVEVWFSAWGMSSLISDIGAAAS